MSISGDGTRIGFMSSATNYTAFTPFSRSRAFLKNLATGTLSLVSESSVGNASDEASFDTAQL